MLFNTYHVEYRTILNEHSIDGQLHFINGAHNNGADLEGPPLKGYHQEPWHTQTQELPPLRQALKAPPTPGLLMQAPALNISQEGEGGKVD